MFTYHTVSKVLRLPEPLFIHMYRLLCTKTYDKPVVNCFYPLCIIHRHSFFVAFHLPEFFLLDIFQTIRSPAFLKTCKQLDATRIMAVQSSITVHHKQFNPNYFLFLQTQTTTTRWYQIQPLQTAQRPTERRIGQADQPSTLLRRHPCTAGQTVSASTQCWIPES